MRNALHYLLILSSVFIIAGCSGGGSSSLSGGNGSITGGVSGTAATGAPIANATVTLVDSAGKTASGTTGTDGTFNIAGSLQLTPPFMLKITNSTGKTYYSVSADSNRAATINVTPLTDMIIRAWYYVQGATVDAAFSNPSANPPPTPTEVKVIATVISNTILPALQAAGVNTANFSPISTPFQANGTGVDGVIHNTTVTVNSTTGSITVAVNTSGGTQNSTVTTGSGSVAATTTTTTAAGSTSSATSTATTVPTTSAQSAALDGINTSITNFINMVNQKGPALAASDIATYVDPGFMDNGIDAAQWEARMAQQLSGVSMSYTGLQVLSMNSSNTVAEVSFQVSMTKNGITSTKLVHVYFKLISGAWLISGDGNIADAYVTLWGWDHTLTGSGCTGSGCYVQTVRFEVDDPEPTPQVVSVTVSGPNLTGAVNVPVVCDNTGKYSTTNCGSSYGGNTQRAFQIPDTTYTWWPAAGAQYTYTLTKSNGTTATVVSTVNAAHGFDSSGNPILADYPKMPSAGLPAFSQALAGTTVHGSVYVPIWDTDASQNPPHYNYEGPGGVSNGVSNQVVYGTWDAGAAVPGQTNNFTIVIPAATNVTPTTCPSGTGTCYNITFMGQTGTVQAAGWFGADACDSSEQSGGASCANSGVQIQ